MRKIHWLIAFWLCVATALTAQNRPRLVVMIAIDGLQSEHLTTLSNNFEKGGLRRLTEGIAVPRAHCNYINGGAATDYVSLVTGSVPYYHGIVAAKRYNLVEDNLVPVFYDGRFHGINSTQTISAKQLETTTLADILKLTDAKSKVFAVTLTPDNAIAFGGHSADGSIWLDDATGKLATTDWYAKGLPAWADKINQGYTIGNYLQYEWRPLYNTGTYKNASNNSNLVLSKPDEHQTLDEQIYRFKHTPFVNTLMKDLAIRALRDEKLGTDASIDLLTVEFTVKLPNEQGNALNSIAKEDIYLRLDKDLRLLFDAINISVGLEHTLVVVVGNEQNPFSLQQLSHNQIQNGTFNAKRSMALLNAYLMAIYGQGRYVSGYYGGHIYLNKTLIEQQKINRRELEEHVAQFMTEFQGVHCAYTSADIKTAGDHSPHDLAKIRNSAHRGMCGDVVFTLLPGWCEVNDRNEIVGTPSIRNATMPVYLFGAGITAQTTETQANVTDITPTICDLLQVPYPNGCIGSPLAK